MSPIHEQCIYCSVAFDATIGEGDHIIPAALGEFRADVRFRRICQRCNNRIGRSEQQLLQCGLESVLRTRVRTRGRRIGRRGSSQLPAVRGAPTPQSTVDRGDHRELVCLDRADPSKAMPIDQLVIHDGEGHEQFIRLFPGMSGDDIHKRIRRWGRTPKKVWVHCTQSRIEEYLEHARTALPGGTLQQLPDTEAGVHSESGRTKFILTDHFFRAIAKIALHYYLVHTRRRVRGDEPSFAAIRDFIMDGGEKDRFFQSSGTKFVMPFGNLPGGRCITPVEWCHILAANETEGVAVVYVQLFVGPGSVPLAHYITLGAIPSSIILPDLVWGHVYRYDRGGDSARYSGQVEEASLTGTRPWRW